MLLRWLVPYVIFVPVLWACDGTKTSDADATRDRLTTTADWTFLEPIGDPFRQERPSPINCGVDGWGLENDRIEIDTGRCNYLALVQSASTGAASGAHVVGTVSHYDLTASEPSLAHAALVVDGKVLWEQRVQIPGPAAVINLDIEVTQPFRKGVPVVLHLHNHGQNNWQVAPLFVVK